jgi:hypothetical protein
VILPLLPAFDKINAIRAVQYFNLKSIKIGQHSIYGELIKEGMLDCFVVFVDFLDSFYYEFLNI